MRFLMTVWSPPRESASSTALSAACSASPSVSQSAPRPMLMVAAMPKELTTLWISSTMENLPGLSLSMAWCSIISR